MRRTAYLGRNVVQRLSYGMLIVMMGFPATGKTSVANALAQRIGAAIVSKDHLRRAAFAPCVLDYSAAQNDLCMEMVYSAVAYIVRSWPEKPVIVDGRTYSQRAQIERLVACAGALGTTPRFIECTCDDEMARRRLESPSSLHAAADRDYARYLEIKSRADPIEVPRLTLDTGSVAVEEAVSRCVAYLGAAASA
jgi:predicted kinase